MEMKINSKRIREERQRRAWSQEHLAVITGLGLRTIQRIESSGQASNDSIAAIAAVLHIPVDQLMEGQTASHSITALITGKRLWVVMATFLIATVIAPPEASLQLAIMGAVWIIFEFTLAAMQWKKAGS